MKTPTVLVILAAILILGGVLLWSVPRIFAKETDRTRSPSSSQPQPDPREAREANKRRSEERSPTSSAHPGLLRLTVLDSDGKRAHGKLYWTTSATPPMTSSMLAPESAYSLPAKAGSKEHLGSADLAIPPGHWTWLRATGPSLESTYERLPPFSGEKKLVVNLSTATRGLHVFVLESDLTRPAAHREVTVYQSDIRSGGPVGAVGRQKTDAWGYARFRGLEPGAFLVCAPDTEPGAAPPHTARVILPPGMPTTEMPLTVVVPERTYEVELRVHASFGRAQAPGRMPSKLYLKRAYERMGQLFPAPGAITERIQVEKFQVPKGLYEVGVQPLGSMVIGSGSDAIDVKPGGEHSFEIFLKQNEVETEVTLKGLPEFPVTVYPRPVQGIWDGNHDLYFCGPYRWRLNPQKVCGPPEPSYLVASGKARFWISKYPVRLIGGQIRVEFMPASRVEVQWCSRERPQRENSYLVEVASPLGEHTMSLKPYLAQVNGESVPALSGVFVVPMGELRLECLDPDSGKTMWKKTVQANHARLTVSVGSDG